MDRVDLNKVTPALFFSSSSFCVVLSAFHTDKSAVIVSVHGPMEVKARKEIIDKATIEVIYKPRTGLAGLFILLDVEKLTVLTKSLFFFSLLCFVWGGGV
jgi:hypothetical protein